MTARPCLDCGEPTTGTRCPSCRSERQRRSDAGRDRRHAHWNTGRWKALSARVRRAQPFCTDCGATADLTADHIIPIRERPDLTYRVENIAIRCRSCNGRKAGRPPTEAERAAVLARLPVRLRDVTTRGGTPHAVSFPPAPQPQERSHTGGAP